MITWGDVTTSAGSAMDQSIVIEADHRFCAARSYSVLLSVTDKDGASGITQQPLLVSRRPIPIAVPSPVNIRGLGNGVLTVNILSTPSFDARTVEPATATLSDGQGAPVTVAVQNNGGLMASFEDTNGDGLLDLVLHFRRTEFVSAANLSSGTPRAVLLATMKDGCVQVRGSTSIRVVP